MGFWKDRKRREISVDWLPGQTTTSIIACVTGVEDV
jgi:hypothetical protein